MLRITRNHIGVGLELIIFAYAQDTDKASDSGQRLSLVRHRHQDCADGNRRLPAAALRQVVVFFVVCAGLCGILCDVYRHRPQICRTHRSPARPQNLHLQDLQRQGLHHHSLHDYAWHHAPAHPACSGFVHRLVLLRPGARPAVCGHPFHHPLEEIFLRWVVGPDVVSGPGNLPGSDLRRLGAEHAVAALFRGAVYSLAFPLLFRPDTFLDFLSQLGLQGEAVVLTAGLLEGPAVHQKAVWCTKCRLPGRSYTRGRFGVPDAVCGPVRTPEGPLVYETASFGTEWEQGVDFKLRQAQRPANLAVGGAIVEVQCAGKVLFLGFA